MTPLYNPPKVPSERSPFVDFISYLVKWITSERVSIRGWTYRQTAEGKFYEPPAIIAPKAAGGSQGFKIVSDGGDYYNCYTYDGVTTGTTLTKVAKEQHLRAGTGAITSRTERSTAYTYAYTAVSGTTTDGVNVIEYTRTVSVSGTAIETDYVTPCLNIGDTIEAVAATFAGPSSLTSVTWLALSAGRTWSK